MGLTPFRPGREVDTPRADNARRTQVLSEHWLNRGDLKGSVGQEKANTAASGTLPDA